jgi:hypothetical protein
MGDKRDGTGKRENKDKRGAHEAKKSAKSSLPQTRAELLALHRETRARRNSVAHSSPEHVEAVDLLGRIEIEIARIERAMDPPLV